jgi:hypothetical protein
MGSLVLPRLYLALEFVVDAAHLSAKYGEIRKDVLSFSVVKMMHLLMSWFL